MRHARDQTRGITEALQALERKTLLETAHGSLIIKDPGFEECTIGLYGPPGAERQSRAAWTWNEVGESIDHYSACGRFALESLIERFTCHAKSSFYAAIFS